MKNPECSKNPPEAKEFQNYASETLERKKISIWLPSYQGSSHHQKPSPSRLLRLTSVSLVKADGNAFG